MSKNPLARILTAALLLAVLWLPAQTPTSSIQGTVKDITGAVMVAVSVVVTNVQTGVAYTAVSNQAGEYLAAYLLPGEYTVRAEAPGFKRFVRAGITLEMEQKARIDIEMAVGSNTETVEVVAAAPLLQSEQVALGQVVNLMQVRDLPLQGVGRNPLSLASLVPGVFDQQGAAFASIGGGRAAASTILLDGVGNTHMNAIHTPSVDAVQEFKVLTHAFSAEYGRMGGGVVSLSIKSGTNQFHGNLFEFFRNDVLNARDFFSLPGSRKPALRYNEFGGTLGGPVLKNRLFFFTSYQGVRQRMPGTSVNTVPTVLQSQGIFTEGNQARIYDPATTRPDPANPSRTLRDEFAGKRVPASRIDAPAARLMQLFPAPTVAGLVSNYVVSTVGARSSAVTDNRIDYRLTSSDNLMFRYSRGGTSTTTGKVVRPGTSTQGQDRNVTLQEVHTFTPRLINEFRAAVSYRANKLNPVGYPGPGAGEFEIPNFPSLGTPAVSISGTSGVGGPTGRGLQDQSYLYLYLVDSMTWVRGRHVLKAGVDIQKDRHRRFQMDVGALNFDATYTSQPGVGNTGLGLASFLLGMPTRATLTLSQIWLNFRSTASSFFVQDDWKAASGLTLNLGFRFDGVFPMTEINDQISVFSLGTGKLDRVGRDGRPRSPYDFTGRLGPRFGFAWQPGWLRHTVLRGGYGISQSSLDRYNQPLTFPWGMGGVVSMTSPDNLTPPFVLSQGPPPAVLRVPEGTTGPGFGADVTNIQRRPSVDYVQNWQLSVQRELVPQKILLEVAYGGSKGTHLLAASTLNQVRPDRMGPGDAQARRPYPAFQLVENISNPGSSIYHSLQVKADGRLARGAGFLVSYTYAREIDDFSGPRGDASNSGTPQFIQNVYNTRAERGIGGFNFPQRLVASYSYPLPLGRGQRWLSSGGWPGVLAGGWRLAGITTLQSGGPVQISASPNNCNCFNGGLRPNRIRDGRIPDAERSLVRYFDTGAFTAPAQYTFGNSERNLLLAPGTLSLDLSVSRRASLLRGDPQRYVEFRSDFFNLFNTPQFNPPNAVLGTPQFGMITSARAARVIQLALKLYF
jgi:hypothetical protein